MKNYERLNLIESLTFRYFKSFNINTALNLLLSRLPMGYFFSTKRCLRCVIVRAQKMSTRTLLNVTKILSMFFMVKVFNLSDLYLNFVFIYLIFLFDKGICWYRK